MFDETRGTGNPAAESIAAARRDAAGARWPAIVCNDAGRRMIQVSNDFRHAESTEKVSAAGNTVWMLYCEERAEGRWEPFMSLVQK